MQPTRKMRISTHAQNAATYISAIYGLGFKSKEPMLKAIERAIRAARKNAR